MVKYIGIFLLVLSVSACLPRPSTDTPPPSEDPILYDRSPLSKYDKEICESSKKYLPIPDKIFGCTLGKAQLYQESRLDPNAKSPAGAEGIAQFMPPTWEETMLKMGIEQANPRMASVAIQAWGYYMESLRAIWKANRKEKDRMQLTQASYNAGAGNM